MLKRLKIFVRKTPLATPYIYLKGKVTRPRTQNEEGAIIDSLVARFDPPKCFVEFGFGGWEFNCARLAYQWDGLLIDGDAYNVRIARIILPRRVVSKHCWITRERLSVVRDYAKGRAIGILSIDVDGNDYWFLEALIDLRPAIIIAEYNSSFGKRSITIPYRADFDYEFGFYYGASLSALSTLAARHDYSLIATESTGVNAFFVRNDLLGPDDRPLDPDQAYREYVHWTGATPAERWDTIRDRDYVSI